MAVIERQEKRQLIELALAAGRRYESPQTGLIHYCYEDETSRETIPFYQNFCFCLALLRSLVGDHIQEGKERLEHLLAFLDERGLFPTYLHAYPHKAFDIRSSFPLKLIEKHFGHVLGDALRDKLRQVTPVPPPPKEIFSSRDAALAALHLEDLSSLAPFWDPQLGIYCGPLGDERYRKGELETTLFDLFMASATRNFSSRILKPHPIHMEASLVFPTPEVTSFPRIRHPIPPSQGRGYHLFRHTWKEEEQVYTLVCQDKKLTFDQDTFTYPEEMPDEKNRHEISFYVNTPAPPLINGERGTVFRLGDLVTISDKVSLTFEKHEGEGDVLGHISKGNRPGQIDPDIYTAYDWKVAIRTLRRSPKFSLELVLRTV